MNEFKADDRVMNKDGTPFSNGEMVLTVERICSNGLVWFKETGKFCSQQHIHLANEYPNPPHKHRDLIIAWANGAKIECLGFGDTWDIVENPNWKSDHYRIKPTKSKQQLEIESIENEMRKLADRLNVLKTGDNHASTTDIQS